MVQATSERTQPTHLEGLLAPSATSETGVESARRPGHAKGGKLSGSFAYAEDGEESPSMKRGPNVTETAWRNCGEPSCACLVHLYSELRLYSRKNSAVQRRWVPVHAMLRNHTLRLWRDDADGEWKDYTIGAHGNGAVVSVREEPELSPHAFSLSSPAFTSKTFDCGDDFTLQTWVSALRCMGSFALYDIARVHAECVIMLPGQDGGGGVHPSRACNVWASLVGVGATCVDCNASLPRSKRKACDVCGATVCASCLAALIGSETNLPSPFGAPTTENAASTAVVSRCKTCAQTLEWRHEDAQAFNAALDAGDTELLRQAFAQVCLFTAVPIPGGPRAPRDVLCAFGSEARFSPVHRSGRPNAPDAMCLVKAGVKANDPSFLRFACAEIKASVDALDATHVSPLMFALDVYRQHHTAAHPLLHQSLECLHVLVSAGANVSAPSAVPRGYSGHGTVAEGRPMDCPLSFCARHGLSSPMELILTKLAKDLHSRVSRSDSDAEAEARATQNILDRVDDRGLTPLMEAACGGHVGLCEVLLEAGASAHVRDTRGRTALFHAATCGAMIRDAAVFERLVVALLESGGSVDVVDSEGSNVMHTLLAHFAPLESGGAAPVTRAHVGQAVAVLMRAGIDVSTSTRSGLDALDVACEQKQWAAAEHLIRFHLLCWEASESSLSECLQMQATGNYPANYRVAPRAFCEAVRELTHSQSRGTIDDDDKVRGDIGSCPSPDVAMDAPTLRALRGGIGGTTVFHRACATEQCSALVRRWLHSPSGLFAAVDIDVVPDKQIHAKIMPTATRVGAERQGGQEFGEGQVEASLMTPLMHAALRRDPGLTALLLSHGACANATTPDTARAALMMAAMGTNASTPSSSPGGGALRTVATALLAAGALVNAADAEGNTALHFAARFGSSGEGVREMLRVGARADIRNRQSHMPVHVCTSVEGRELLCQMAVATFSASWDVVLALASRGNFGIDIEVEVSQVLEHMQGSEQLQAVSARTERLLPDAGYTPLAVAAIHADVSGLLELVVRGGADVNHVSLNGLSALEAACTGSNPTEAVRAAKELVRHGARISQCAEALVRLATEARDAELLDMVVAAVGCAVVTALDKEGANALSLICFNGDMKLLERVTANQKTQRENSGKPAAWWLLDLKQGAGPQKLPALTIAAMRGHLAVCEALIALDKEQCEAAAVPSCQPSIHAASQEGATALMYACREGHGDIAKSLLVAGLDPNASTTLSKETSLIMAARRGHIGCVEALLEHGAFVPHESAAGGNALALAREGEHTEVVKALRVMDDAVRENRLDVAATCLSRGNFTVDYEAVVHPGDACLPDVTEDTPITLLSAACIHGDVKSMKQVIALGADVNRKMRHGSKQTPLALAAKHGRTGAVKFLLHNRAKANTHNSLHQSPLHEVLQSDDPSVSLEARREIAGLLLNAGISALRQDSNGISPLLLAVRLIDPPILELFLAHHAESAFDLDSPHGAAKSTALMEACALGSQALVRLLLNAGADACRKDAAARTPIHYACEAGHTHVMQYLLNASNATLAEADASGMTPLMAASERGNTDVGIFAVAEMMNSHLIDLSKDLVRTQRELNIARSRTHVSVVDQLQGIDDEAISRMSAKEVLMLDVALEETLLQVRRLRPDARGAQSSFGGSPTWQGSPQSPASPASSFGGSPPPRLQYQQHHQHHGRGTPRATAASPPEHQQSLNDILQQQMAD